MLSGLSNRQEQFRDKGPYVSDMEPGMDERQSNSAPISTSRVLAVTALMAEHLLVLIPGRFAFARLVSVLLRNTTAGQSLDFVECFVLLQYIHVDAQE